MNDVAVSDWTGLGVPRMSGSSSVSKVTVSDTLERPRRRAPSRIPRAVSDQPRMDAATMYGTSWETRPR